MRVFKKFYAQSPLDQIIHKVAQLQHLNQLWQFILTSLEEALLAQHTRVANLRDGTLIIEVDNPVWASRLHYMRPDLLRTLTLYPELNQLEQIRWYLYPEKQSGESGNLLPGILRLSHKNKGLLRTTALIVENKNLQEALLRLSNQAT